MTEQFVCGYCKELYHGLTARWGQCPECGLPLCAKCWALNRRHCALHSPKTDSAAPESTYPLCSFCAKELILKKDLGGICQRCGALLCSDCFAQSPFCAQHRPILCAFGHEFHPDLSPGGTCKICGALLCGNHYNAEFPYCPEHQPVKCCWCEKTIRQFEEAYIVCPRCEPGAGYICQECAAAGNSRCPQHALVQCARCSQMIEPEAATPCQEQGCSKVLCPACRSAKFCPDHRPIICSHCGLARPAIAYKTECSAPECHRPVCDVCAAALGSPMCLAHERTIPLASRRLWLRAAEYILFNRVTTNLKDQELTFHHPWTGKPLTVRARDLEIRELAARPPEDSAAIGRDLPLNRTVVYRISIKRGAFLELELRFWSRLARLSSPGFDLEPIRFAELLPVIESLTASMTRDTNRIVGLASPTGFEDHAIELVVGLGSQAGFYHDRLVVALYDLTTQRLIYDEKDPRTKLISDFFRAETKSERFLRVTSAVTNELIGRYGISEVEIATLTALTPNDVRDCFKELDGKGFRVEYIEGLLYITDQPLR